MKKEKAGAALGALKKSWAVIAVALLLGLAFIAALETVDTGYVGIVKVLGQMQEQSLEPGLHFVIPFATTVTEMDIKTQKLEIPAEASSRDLQLVTATIVVNYRVNDIYATKLYRSVGMNYEPTIISPAVLEAFKAAVAGYSADQLITQRPKVSQVTLEELKAKIESYGLVVEAFNIANLNFSAEFNAAIEAKQQAEQAALKAEQDLKRIEVEAEQKIAQARAIADATRLQADAEAYAIEKINATLQQSPTYVNYLMVTRWDGALPLVEGSSNPIVDLRDLTAAAGE
ncbi:MAG: prohibitin family protein [Gracilibacteraceae bacterium]|jgi:regulator of protease activity HflC (stomatin/prohibitin superfamily)|nr:prohibitin family protein [Gracilibacteraceae bacterium]